MDIGRVLTIAGSDSGGGAGIQADLKTITVLGGFGMSVVTALTAQNTEGVQGIHEVPAAFVKLQFDAVASDIGVDAAKTGMLATSEVIAAVADMLVKYRVDKLVVDPVMVAKGGARLIRDDARDTMRERLLPLAMVITPNVPEAEVLAGMIIRSVDAMKEAARRIHALGPRYVFVKGGHMEGDARDLLYDGKDCYQISSPRIDTKDTHGTGCTLSAAIATGLAQDMSVLDAVKRAKICITTAIRHALRLGKGHGPTNHAAMIFHKNCRGDYMEDLCRIVSDEREGITCDVNEI